MPGEERKLGLIPSIRKTQLVKSPKTLPPKALPPKTLPLPGDVTEGEEERCPGCGMSYDRGKKRRLVEDCGHQRCLTCICHHPLCPFCQDASLFYGQEAKRLILPAPALHANRSHVKTNGHFSPSMKASIG
ncbi:unnamed protein product [Darwinula stevensoni]|uniref:RING-type domain-containing protein n=1 Tax=Darwinula stevensoni TaxID=69355 RepID=A0A7R8XBG5_9CRUS|nr:unnamed protein product [Darwinula stevensoni]CAG0891205.1 unnamed protein product [Darwinula stevensoni]